MNVARDTIFAVSSGLPPAAIAVIRVSGPTAMDVGADMGFRLPEPRRAALRVLRDGRGELIDRALVLVFPVGESATGEPLVELHVHGGRAVVKAVLARLLAINSFRPALPGEFTKRAVVNGRMDLLEAEALGDLLAAETEDQRRRANLGATLIGSAVAAWEAELVRCAAEIELMLDHDEDHQIDGGPSVGLERIEREMRAMLERPSSERLRDGFRVIIAGPPNAGKSTLLNAIVGRSVAITSPLEGTTRDMVEVPLEVDGIAIRLSDSPGLRADTMDPIERIGIMRAREAIAEADLLLWLDRTDPPEHVPSIRVASKSDLAGVDAGCGVRVSGKTGAHLNELLQRVGMELRRLVPGLDEASLNRRQAEAVERARVSLAQALASTDLLLQAEELRSARAALGTLTGRGGIEALLDEVFSRFCLGK